MKPNNYFPTKRPTGKFFSLKLVQIENAVSVVINKTSVYPWFHNDDGAKKIHRFVSVSNIQCIVIARLTC